MLISFAGIRRRSGTTDRTPLSPCTGQSKVGKFSDRFAPAFATGQTIPSRAGYEHRGKGPVAKVKVKRHYP
jgi:hypothetical protein